MSQMNYTFTVNGEVWKKSHLERLEYERNLHVLHQMKRHGVEIKEGEEIFVHACKCEKTGFFRTGAGTLCIGDRTQRDNRI